MKNRLRLIAVLLSGLISIAAADQPEGFTTLNIGDPAPPFELLGIDGETYTLANFSEPEVLMIYFTGTHCPTSHGIEQRLQQLVRDMKDKSFQVVAINPNNDAGMRPDEYSYTHYTESYEDSKRYATDLNWTFPFLYDGEQQVIAKAYGCLATPHVFIFDKERKLRYTGRFDDSRFAEPETVTQPDARNAVMALLAGTDVPVEQTRPIGCSTKWKEKSVQVAADDQKWSDLPATIEEIDAEAVKSLRQNESGKIRLINVWATWCAPCIAELPDLSALGRRFSRREFEIITISLDKKEDMEKARAILDKRDLVMSDKIEKSVQAEGRSTNNYLYPAANTDALAEALDPEWSGSLPYTILLDKNGDVLLREGRKIDPQVVIDKVLEKIKTKFQKPQ